MKPLKWYFQKIRMGIRSSGFSKSFQIKIGIEANHYMVRHIINCDFVDILLTLLKIFIRNEYETSFKKIGRINAGKSSEYPLIRLQYSNKEFYIDRKSCFVGEEGKGMKNTLGNSCPIFNVTLIRGREQLFGGDQFPIPTRYKISVWGGDQSPPPHTLNFRPGGGTSPPHAHVWLRYK